MAFSLTIQEGTDAGRQYTFDQPEVAIGRTAENDVVLLDPGVSRRHAVIRSEGGRFFVQDVGSANGTQVNGNPIAEEELQAGDLLAVGPVVLSFEALQDDGATRILDTEAIAAQAARRAQARSSPAQLAETRRRTAMVPVRRPALMPAEDEAPAAPAPRRRSTPPGRPGASSRALARPASRSVARPSASPPSKSLAKPRARPRPLPSTTMSASERARFLREHGRLAPLKLFLMEKPPAVRHALLGGAGLIGLLLVLLVVKGLAGGGQPVAVIGDRSKTTFQLADSEDVVFGLGEHLGVTVQTRDELRLEFEYSETIPSVYTLRFESLGVERADEVDITLNGVHIGNVAPGLGDYTKEQRVRLPKKHLKAGIPNEVIFDNAFNPPGNEPWAISKIRLDIKPLPGGSPSELLAMAKKNYDIADQLMGMKDVAAPNRYNAWIALHRALLFLEAVEPKPELYNLVQQSLREVDRELDTTCSRIMLTAKKHEELNHMDKALSEYKGGLLWFPGDDHPCRERLIGMIYEYGEAPP